MHLKTETIETKRLCLRQFIIEDAEDAFRNYCSDPEVTRFLTWPVYTQVETAYERMNFMQKQYRENSWGDWAIVLKELGQVIGSIGVVAQDDRTKAVEIGYCIGSRWWHQGIMTEAFGAVIDYLFSQTEVNRISARHDTRNPHSGLVMKKCGLRYEGTFRQGGWDNQGICDEAIYGILKEDWLKGIRP